MPSPNQDDHRRCRCCRQTAPEAGVLIDQLLLRHKDQLETLFAAALEALEVRLTAQTILYAEGKAYCLVARRPHSAEGGWSVHQDAENHQHYPDLALCCAALRRSIPSCADFDRRDEGAIRSARNAELSSGGSESARL